MSAGASGPKLPGLAYVDYLGGGGFGDVYLYENVGLRRKEAVKIIREGELSDVAVAQFMAEADAMAGLEHPHIVLVYETGTVDDGRPYLRMQYYSGGTMEARASNGRLSIAEVLRTGVEIGGALETAHRAGLLHRDIKPANILVSAWGTTGLTDFGVASDLGAAEHPGEDVGVSIPWAAPEMIYCDTRGSVQSDVYSLAATIWHLVVGRPPFEIPSGDNSRLELMNRVRSLPPPETGRPDCPAALDNLLRQAMSKDPARRPPSVADFVRSLQRMEDDLNLPRTKAIVLDASRGVTAAPEPAMGASSDAGTMVRPRRGAASVPPVVRTGGADVKNDELGRARTQLRPATAGQAGPRQESTQLRPRTSTVTIEPGPDPVATGMARGTLIAIGVGLLVVVAVLGWLLLESGGGAEDPRPLATVSAAPEADEAALPPGPVMVKVKRSGSSVNFTWNYDNVITTDSYRLKFGEGGETASTKRAVSVPAPPKGEVCLSVIVMRADGTNTTKDFPAATCG